MMSFKMLFASWLTGASSSPYRHDVLRDAAKWQQRPAPSHAPVAARAQARETDQTHLLRQQT
eukprot:691092-Prorocentrum_lima.AAC.1